MASSDRFYMPLESALDAAGAIEPGASLYFYETGTTTPKDTYSEQTLVTPNTNPVVANAAGRFGPIFLGSGDYKVVLKDADSVEVWTADPVAKATTSAATTSVAGAIEIATEAEALIGTSTTLAIVPDTAAAMIQQGFSYGTTGGTANAITGTPSITPSALAAGMKAIIKATGTNSGATTFNWAGLGVVAVKVYGLTGGAACVGNEIISGNTYEFTYSAADSCWYVSSLGDTPPIPASVAAKTASYTVVDADRGGFLRFSGLGADATLTLPAASGRSGFEITVSMEHMFADNVVNTTPLGLTFDPNGAELIDGLASIKTFGKSCVTIVCDGTGWRKKAGKWLYFSGNQSLTAAGTFTLAHGLPARPSRVWYCYQNVTAEVNYTQYDLVYTNADFTDGGTSEGHGCVPNATNLVCRIGASGTFMINKTTGVVALLTAASWKIQFYAED